MKKIGFLLLVVLFGINCFSQQNQLWKGYLSYYNIKDVSQTSEKVYAASENALFSKNMATQELKVVNSVNDFKAETITAMHHSAAFNKTLVGNQNGLLLVVDETQGTVLNVLDILNKPSIPPNRKKINHIYEYNGKVYLSCDFGICVFDLTTNQFGDTYFIGPAGEEVVVYQTTFYNGFLYAVTQSHGIRRADYANPNLVDFAQWSTFDGNSWYGIVTFQNQLILAHTDSRIYKYSGGPMQEVIMVGQTVLDLRDFDNHLVITAAGHVYVYDASLIQVAHVTQIPDVISTFTCATVINDKLFIGTEDKGLYETTLGSTSFENITPDGPARNKIFRLKKTNEFLWAVYGGYTKQYNPFEYCCGGPSEFEISKHSESEGWGSIPYAELLGAKAISNITVNPTNSKQLYFGSFYSGLLKVTNSEVEFLYNSSNSPLDDIIPNVSFIGSSAFDKDGSLWVTNSRVRKGLKVLKKDGQWTAYDFTNITTNPLSDSYSSIVVDRSGTKWIGSYRNGVIGFNEKYNNKFILIKSGTDNGNLPDNDVRSIAIDKNNQLWIGTFAGLRILPSVDRFVTETDLETNPIIILDNNLAQELFYQQSIMDIVVDGSNNKWLSIDGSGAFLVSSNGQKTLYHFTKENSPLPSNNVLDIEIDEVTGEVYFATDKGLVSFKGISTKPADDLSQVFVYPNPVRPGYEGTVKISGLIDDANIKITDIEGNLVYETTSEGGTIEWDTRAFGKHKVASGVYMILIASEDGTETRVKKVMIVR